MPPIEGLLPGRADIDVEAIVFARDGEGGRMVLGRRARDVSELVAADYLGGAVAVDCLTEPALAATFLREYGLQVAASEGHGHIIHVHGAAREGWDDANPGDADVDVGVGRGAGDLRGARRGPRAPLRAAPMRSRLIWLAQVADAVAHCHSLRIVHGGIKTGNILLVRPTGGAAVAKLTDFKAAHRVAAPPRAAPADAAEVVPTPAAAMSAREAVGAAVPVATPEAAAAEAYAGDVAAFALAAWQVCAGELPFIRDLAGLSSMEALQVVVTKLVGGTRPPPDLLAARGVPPAVIACLDACWDRDPVARPSARAVADTFLAAAAAADDTPLPVVDRPPIPAVAPSPPAVAVAGGSGRGGRGGRRGGGRGGGRSGATAAAATATTSASTTARAPTAGATAAAAAAAAAATAPSSSTPAGAAAGASRL